MIHQNNLMINRRCSIFLLTVLMSMVGAKSFANDIEVANADGVIIYYNIINNYELEVTFKGLFSTSYPEYSGNIVIPESVNYQSMPYKVTTIGNEAFYENNSLLSVTIPSSVKTIGAKAFGQCQNLTSLTLPNSVTSIGDLAFTGSGLREPLYNSSNFAYLPKSYEGAYDIPEGITSIAPHAFYVCKALTSITIPNSVTNIGKYAFYGCEIMTSLTIGTGLTTVGKYAFQNAGIKHIDIDCKEIGDWFDQAPEIKDVTIGEHVQKIGKDAFYGRKKLTSVKIGSNVDSIGDNAFYGCKGLTSIDFPEKLTVIGGYAFYGCSGLTSITIPNSVSYCGWGAFQNCI